MEISRIKRVAKFPERQNERIEPVTQNREPQQRISIAITGSGGAGVMTAGGMLLEAAAKGGWYALQTRAVGPQIRGGEAAALLRLSTTPVEIHDGPFNIVFAVDWMNFDRFAAEIRLTGDTIVLADPEAGEPPARVADSGARVLDIPVKAIVKAVEGARPNMIALGVLAGAVGLPEDVIDDLITTKLQSKGEKAVSSSIAAAKAGYEAAETLNDTPRLAPATSGPDDHWIITGNQAAALGAVRGGIRFAAAYPITPATEILEWLSSALPKVGGRLVQAEDELASINMAIGASYGGIPSITATSGPGYALMTEAIGLATASEVPVVIVDVMRGGPSTGIPTKSEQSDLNIAIYGLHGDAPHIVVAPNSIADCLFTTQWAAHLADAMQVPAVVLSDQLLGQASVVIEKPANVSFLAKRQVAEQPGEAYDRYAVTESGVSPMALPGTTGGQYTADGLTHSPDGRPSTKAEDHEAQLEKRDRKLTGFDYGNHWADIEGEGEIAILTWGSSSAAVSEAANRVRENGLKVKTISMRLLSPPQPEKLAEALQGVEKLLVVEQTHSGQFLQYVRAQYDLNCEVRSLRRPSPLPIGVSTIVNELNEWSQS